MKKKRSLLLSVIIITYNQERYISQAIESVLMQKTDFSIELLIGDDSSADGTADIVMFYASKYPEIIIPVIREKNIGASANYYDLLKRAKGTFIANLEGDDFWTDPMKLQKQVDFLESSNDYIGCSHRCSIVNSDGIVISDKEPKWIIQKQIYKLSDFKGLFLPGHPNSIVFRNIFLKSAFDDSIIGTANYMVADRVLIAILAAHGSFFRIPDCMSSYRVVPDAGGATEVLFAKNKDNWLINIDLSIKIEQFLKNEFGIRINFAFYRNKVRIRHFCKLIYCLILKNKK